MPPNRRIFFGMIWVRTRVLILVQKTRKEGVFMAKTKCGGKNPYAGNSGKPVAATGIKKTTNSIKIKTPKG